MSAQTATKRLKGKIKPPKKQIAAENEFTNTWQRLDQAIQEIHRKNASLLSYEELYRNAYNMVLHKNGEKLYNGVKAVISSHLEDVATEQIMPAVKVSGGDAASGSDQGAAFLKVLKKVWTEHTTCMLMIRDILMYMDRVYAKTANVPLVYDLGLDLFRDIIARSTTHPIQSHLLQVMLEQIRLEREGDVIDRSVIKSAVDMMLELADGQTVETIYAMDFEGPFLDASKDFYNFESQTLVSECDAPEYMRRVEKRLLEEQERTRHYLSSSTGPKIKNIVEEELIKNHVKTIMDMENSGLIPMLRQDKINDISRMYKLFSRVSNGHSDMRKAIGDYVRELGKAINFNVMATTPSTLSNEKEKDGDKQGNSVIALRWVQEVLDLKDKFDRILDAGLQKDKTFQTAVNEAFERFVNENQKSPEYISLFIDENLKKGLKGKTEEEIDTVLDKTITLFRFVQEKDVFERYYKQHLAKRLLFNRSISDDAERGMIAKLKIECGYQFTTKLEGMFNDMRISTDLMTSFKEFSESDGMERPKIELGVTVLTSTFWPMNVSASPACIYPPEITKACAAYEIFYHKRHSGRKLTWQPNMGSADIRAQFRSKKHELNVSTYGMVILLLFNDLAEGESLSIKDIQNSTDVGEGDLKRTLQSLACGKYRILTKSTKTKDINSDDQFSFNTDFTCALARIKIQTIASKVETEVERKHTQEKVDEERKHQIEAAIVRIMKDRKTMEHNNLISEVTKQLNPRFAPSPQMIKKRIEALIEREYLERAVGDRKCYNYLA